MRNKHWPRKIALFLLFGITALLVFGWVVMTLWNAILPSVTGVSPINFGQALGILLLSKILFGGFRPGGGDRWGSKRRLHWKEHLQHKWSSMSPEEKEKFQQAWQSRCSRWRKSSAPEKPQAE